MAYSTNAELAVDTTLNGANEGDATTGQNLHFYWTHPTGFDPDVDDDDTFDDPNWRVEVQRRVAPETGQEYSGWQAVDGPATPATPITDYAQAQFSVDFNHAEAPDLWGASKSDRRYRVRYLNMAGTTADTDADREDDVPGAWANITIPEVDANYYLAATLTESTLPIITKAESNGDYTTILRSSRRVAVYPQRR